MRRSTTASSETLAAPTLAPTATAWPSSPPQQSAEPAPPRPLTHLAGLATTEGLPASSTRDVAEYVRLSRPAAPEDDCVEKVETASTTGKGSKVPGRYQAGAAGEEEKGVAETTEEPWTYPDGGWRAWGVVFGCWCLCAGQLGYGLVFGVLLADLQERLGASASTLNYIQGLTNILMNITTFFAGRIGDRYGFKRCIATGCVLTIISLVGSGLSYNSLPALFVVQGVLLGFSLGFGMSLYMALPSQWFLRRRGLATGLATSGSGIGGGVASLILRGSMKLGYRQALLIYAAVNAFAFTLGYLAIKERHPPLKPGERRGTKNWLPIGVWTNGKFYSLMGSIAVGVFGFLAPFYYMTALTTTKCPQYEPGSLILATPLVVASIVSGIGRVFAGIVADVIGPVNTLFLSFFLGGLFQLVLWPFVGSFGAIMAFAVLYGFFGSWFIPMLPPACAQVFGTKGLATIVGFGILCNSPGQFFSGSFGGYVLAATPTGNDYSKIGFYSGSTMLVGSLILLYARFTGRRQLWAKY
ncbi:uncharacterized protein JCM10292_007566 [Rhodotorula paludigena]|uniref:uncharacterized protein n=1 Tax=Rhodotorula paludigena TaxID=86838 RepID=UPI0031750258